MRLSDELKSIYTSSDTLTVLKLLREIIKAIDEFEPKTLYKHTLSLSNGNSLVLVTMSDTALTTNSEVVTACQMALIRRVYNGDVSNITTSSGHLLIVYTAGASMTQMTADLSSDTVTIFTGE